MQPDLQGHRNRRDRTPFFAPKHSNEFSSENFGKIAEHRSKNPRSVDAKTGTLNTFLLAGSATKPQTTQTHPHTHKRADARTKEGGERERRNSAVHQSVITPTGLCLRSTDNPSFVKQNQRINTSTIGYKYAVPVTRKITFITYLLFFIPPPFKYPAVYPDHGLPVGNYVIMFITSGTNGKPTESVEIRCVTTRTEWPLGVAFSLIFFACCFFSFFFGVPLPVPPFTPSLFGYVF